MADVLLGPPTVPPWLACMLEVPGKLVGTSLCTALPAAFERLDRPSRIPSSRLEKNLIGAVELKRSTLPLQADLGLMLIELAP